MYFWPADPARNRNLPFCNESVAVVLPLRFADFCSLISVYLEEGCCLDSTYPAIRFIRVVRWDAQILGISTSFDSEVLCEMWTEHGSVTSE